MALDDADAPYLTRVLGSLEIRRSAAPDAPACVALPSPARIRCSATAGLAPAIVADLPRSHLLDHDDRGRLRCNGCHGPNGTMTDDVLGLHDLTPEAGAPDLAERRRLVLDTLRAATSSLWR
jgi:hypothetical protein